MVSELKFSTKQSDGILVGLIGAGIQASRTPDMHEHEAAQLGLKYVYEKIDLDCLGLDVSGLEKLISEAEQRGFSGLNITHPCKQAAMAFVDVLSPDVLAIGAINTIRFRNGQRHGHNTDCSGFAAAFQRDLAGVASRNVVLLGAGGAGAAVAFALLKTGVAAISIFDAESRKAEILASHLVDQFGRGRATAVASVASALAETDGLVNATPMGMDKYPGMALSADLLRSDLWVAEIVYFPIETALLRAARQRGCRVMNGATMAVMQAAHAFEIFTGVAADPVRMQHHFDTAGKLSSPLK